MVNEWIKSTLVNVYGVVAIDVKEARRTKDVEKMSLHAVSDFAHKCGLVLGQIACEEIAAKQLQFRNRFKYMN